MTIKKIFEQNKEAILILDLVMPGEKAGQNKISIRGTGFIIDDEGRFITSAHVYNEIPENERQYLGAKIWAKQNSKGVVRYEKRDIELVGIDDENDIALMKLKSINNEKFKTVSGFGDDNKVTEGEDVVFIGFPLALELIMMQFGLTLSATKAIVSSVKRRTKDGSLHFFMIDSHINNGSSGSPLFHTESGKVIGVAGGKITAKVHGPEGKVFEIPANMGICRPINYIKKIIKEN